MLEVIIEGGTKMADFGKYLKALREKRSLGVNQLAILSGVSSSLISRVENGKRGAPKTSTLDELSKILKVSQIELYFMAGHHSIIQIDPNTQFSDIAYKYMTEEDLEVIKEYKQKNVKLRSDIRKELKKDPENIIGKRIVFLRKEKGIDHIKLAEEIGLEPFVIYNIEKGDYIPDYHLVTILANYFSVPADYLLGRTDDHDAKEFAEGIYDDPDFQHAMRSAQGFSEENKKKVLEYIEMIEELERGRKPGDRQPRKR